MIMSVMEEFDPEYVRGRRWVQAQNVRSINSTLSLEAKAGVAEKIDWRKCL